MSKTTEILTDTFGRQHNYLRISLIEKCNLRCTYCMPEHGVPLTPKENLMTSSEVVEIAKVFVKNGVNKIRLTGGEPLLRKDFSEILAGLAEFPVQISITTNAILVDRFIDDFKKYDLRDINVSLDTLNPEKFNTITKRNQFDKAFENVLLLIKEGFNVKVNVVLLNDFNENEIINFIEFTKNNAVNIRFIEFMPFSGNSWDKSKLVSYQQILDRVSDKYKSEDIISIKNEQNFTARNFKIKDYAGSFGIISSVTNPFCDVCNRIRLTANGKIKNCLFSTSETDLLTALRNGDNIEDVIYTAVTKKKAVRAGMDENADFEDLSNHHNRSMITIGG
ncbi:GTP 3',8-cyclase MoaA [Halpernia frigidisoli]|uniref:GTP 3',8-cyclase n=1 Tax=Halpernia frigidisoli TaxID=1125876 RepID=A0A1I3D483_9FLAO|nr:GTP 3',8-cyclase MoaA [Halpernia frigidisoli]SFH81523.1 cyclic pyranopterin monophosphate synthase subunit MoaA [Halpernia frigidisoli]